MIQKGSFLHVVDNCGAKLVCCIHVYGKKYAFPGDVVLVSIKRLRRKRRARSKVKKGQICKALIVMTKSFKVKKTSFQTRAKMNSVVLLNNNMRAYATRIFSALSYVIRKSKFSKMAVLSKGFYK